MVLNEISEELTITAAELAACETRDYDESHGWCCDSAHDMVTMGPHQAIEVDELPF